MSMLTPFTPASSMNREKLSPARVMGPLVCHEHGTGLFRYQAVLMVTDGGCAGQSDGVGGAGFFGLGFWRCR
jgi:hypothetical protein